MNNKQAKRVGVMWPKAYNSELRKPVMKKGHFSSSKNLHIWYLQPKNSQTHVDKAWCKKTKNTKQQQQELQDKSPLDPEKVSVCKGMKSSRFVKYELIT